MSQRTETAQVYANPDGTWTSEVATDPVRVQDALGNWHDIDTTLVERDGALSPRHAIGGLELSAGGDKIFAALHASGEDMQWQWSSTLPVPSINGSAATYEGAGPEGTDLVVTATATGFSHYLVLHSAPSQPLQLELPVTTDAAELVKTPSGGVEINTPGGRTIASAPAPVMWEGDPSTSDPAAVAPVDVSVSDAPGNASTLSLTPDEDFLNDPSTTYPVTIDPTFTIAESGSTYISNPERQSWMVGDPELRVGTNDLGATKYRTLLKFNDTTWVGKDITSAELKLRNFSSVSCAGAPIRVRRVIDTWSTWNATWANQPDGATAGQASYTPAHGGPTCNSADAEWDLTAIVAGWANQSYPNRGIKLRAEDETINKGFRKYRSSYYNNYPSLRPRLIVTYAGILSTPQYATVSPCPATTCDPEWPVVASLTPQLTASATDHAGTNLTYTFEVREMDQPAILASGTASQTQGTPVSWTIPPDILRDEVMYEFRASVTNGDQTRVGAWSPVGVDIDETIEPPTNLWATPCATTDCGSAEVTSTTPTLNADVPETLTMADTHFEVRKTGETSVIASSVDEAVAGGGAAEYTLATGVLTDGQAYEFRAGIAEAANSPSEWSSWKSFTVSVPASAPTEPSVVQVTGCAALCEDLVVDSTTPTIEILNQDDAAVDVDVELYRDAQAEDGLVVAGTTQAVAAGTSDQWTVPADHLASGTYQFRIGATHAGQTTWTSLRSITVDVAADDETNFPADTAVIDPEDPEVEFDPEAQPDPVQNLEDTTVMTSDPDASETEESASKKPVYVRHAPRLRLHPSENLGPMSATTFINNSQLRWSHNNCDDDKIAKPVDPYKMDRDYSHRDKHGLPCRHDTRWYANQRVHPRKSGGPSGAPEGMFLDLANNERDGAGYNGAEPVYYRFIGLRYVHYWFHYGDSKAIYKGATVPYSHHEGDWEHIAIKLNGDNKPVAVQYFVHKESCTLPWSKVPKYKGHPVVWVAKNAHGSYPAGGRSFKFYGVRPDQISGDGPLWPANRNLKNVFYEPWYGYAGGWGEVGSVASTTGPWGPNPIREADSAPGFGTRKCEF